MEQIARWGGPAAVAGGLLWLVVWAHALAVHGPTQLNRKDVVAGLTWMDSGKVLVACFLLFLVAALALWGRLDHPDRLGTAARRPRFDSGLPRWGGTVQAVASIVYTVGVLLLAIALARWRAPGWWVGLLLVLTAPASLFLTPVQPFVGLAWLVVGLVLWRPPRPT